MYLADLFKQFNPATNKFAPILPKELWLLLSQQGIIVHPLLMKQYADQQSCIFCGGQIVTIQGVTPDRWEQRCNNCEFLFAEDGNTQN